MLTKTFFHYRKVFIPNRFGFFPRSNSEFIKQTLMYYYVHYVQNLARNFFSRFSGKKVFFPENMEQKLFFPIIVHRQVTS